MEKTVKTIVILYKDGTINQRNEGGILKEELNKGWKVKENLPSVLLENVNPEIESITEYTYILYNDSGIIYG